MYIIYIMYMCVYFTTTIDKTIFTCPTCPPQVSFWQFSWFLKLCRNDRKFPSPPELARRSRKGPLGRVFFCNTGSTTSSPAWPRGQRLGHLFFSSERYVFRWEHNIPIGWEQMELY